MRTQFTACANTSTVEFQGRPRSTTVPLLGKESHASCTQRRRIDEPEVHGRPNGGPFPSMPRDWDVCENTAGPRGGLSDEQV